jgi:hypothetical protein
MFELFDAHPRHMPVEDRPQHQKRRSDFDVALKIG